jgi:hypothetical protein
MVVHHLAMGLNAKAVVLASILFQQQVECAAAAVAGLRLNKGQYRRPYCGLVKPERYGLAQYAAALFAVPTLSGNHQKTAILFGKRAA